MQSDNDDDGESDADAAVVGSGYDLSGLFADQQRRRRDGRAGQEQLVPALADDAVRDSGRGHPHIEHRPHRRLAAAARRRYRSDFFTRTLESESYLKVAVIVVLLSASVVYITRRSKQPDDIPLGRSPVAHVQPE